MDVTHDTPTKSNTSNNPERVSRLYRKSLNTQLENRVRTKRVKRHTQNNKRNRTDQKNRVLREGDTSEFYHCRIGRKSLLDHG